MDSKDEEGMSREEREFADNFIEENIQKNEIIIFSKRTCTFCKQAKRLLENEGFAYHAVELDVLKDFGTRVQKRLAVKSNQKTVPNIFIKTHHIGGFSDLKEAYKTGLLFEYVDGKFQSSYDYDLVVIGGGSGGIAAAKEAAKYGKKVAVCDYVKPTPKGTSWGLGGTCVNVGCIPKKLFHKAALLGDEVKNDASHFGLTINNDVSHDWEKLVDSVQKHIKKLNWNYRKELQKKGIKFFPHYANFHSDHTIKFSEGKNCEKDLITAKNVILAMGCRPTYLNCAGAREYCITSDDLFSLKYPPGKTLIVGASYIALECAGFLRGLGFECSVLVRSMILRTFDRAMADRIGSHLESTGVVFLYQHKIEEIILIEDGTPPTLQVKGKDKEGKPFSEQFNTIILAAGREPHISSLGLDAVGVNIHPTSGKILVNDLDQTTNRTVFAIGDVVHGVPELTPVAIKAGVLLVKRLYSNIFEKMNYDIVPTTVFTPIEYSCVGLTEEQAREKFGDSVIIFQTSFRPLETVLSDGAIQICCMKLICVPEEGKHKILGLHVISPNSGEIIQGFVVAMKLGATKEDLDEVLGIHPTCAEVFNNLKLLTGEDTGPDESC